VTYVLILSIIASDGVVTTQRVTGFADYQSCAEHVLMADYVVWRDSVVVPSQKVGGPDAPLFCDARHIPGAITPVN
jgi:hypothetical protein